LRTHQYFDHFPKRATAPEWVAEGAAFIDREDEKEQFNQLRVHVGMESKP